MPSVITIDLDDTLWDNQPTLLYAEKNLYNWLEKNAPLLTKKYSLQTMKEHRCRLALEEPGLAHDMTQLRRESLAQLCSSHGYENRLVDEAMTTFLIARNKVTLYDDALPFLQSCQQQDYKIIALSNGNADVHAIGIGEYFHGIFSPEEAGTAKPDPAMFEHVFTQMQVDASDVLHIGDEPKTDILGAHQAGVRNVWINRNNAKFPNDIPKPDLEVSSLNQLSPVPQF